MRHCRLIVGLTLLVARVGVAQVDTAAAHRALRNPAELESFIDGVMTAQLRDKHVAGAVVAVVRDGALYFAKGYGYADLARRVPVDPAATLFRVGSISKVFTWTAVMQLFERGRLDLNRDLNEYLDFEIPATFPEPITMIHALTHTPGLEEDPRDLFTDDSAQIKTMREWLPAHMPERVRPPGVLSAYSNWATATAGYVVERIAKMPFDDYIDRNILEPLEMTRTTFRQPLPAALRPMMSQGYRYEDGRFDPMPFEMATGGWPAGSVSATAVDMAKFMIAHLGYGAAGDRRILAESTAVKMQQRLFGHDPRMNGWAYGFYEQSSHGLRIIGHGGDTQWFHSNMALIPSERVGVFVSYNTDTGGALTEPFTDAFLDHYYPVADPPAPPRATARELERFAGQYLNNRTNYSTFLKALNLAGAGSIEAADSTALVSRLGGEPVRFVPADSLLFRGETNDLRLAFRVDSSGRVTHAFVSNDPTSAFIKTSGAGSPRLHLLILGVGLVIFALTALAAILRRGFGVRPALPDRPLLVAMSLSFLLAVLVAANVEVNTRTLVYDQLPGVKYVLVLTAVGGILTLAAAVAAGRQWRAGTGSLWSRLRFTATVLVALLFLWSLNSWNLLGWRV